MLIITPTKIMVFLKPTCKKIVAKDFQATLSPIIEVENGYVWKVQIFLETQPFLTETWLWYYGRKGIGEGVSIQSYLKLKFILWDFPSKARSNSYARNSPLGFSPQVHPVRFIPNKQHLIQVREKKHVIFLVFWIPKTLSEVCVSFCLRGPERRFNSYKIGPLLVISIGPKSCHL